MKTFKNSFKLAFLLGILIFGSFVHAQTASSGKWVKVSDLAKATPGNISYGSCDYRLTAQNNTYLPNGVMKSHLYVKLDLEGVQYYNYAPQSTGNTYRYSFEAPIEKINSIVASASSATANEQFSFIDRVLKARRSFPNLSCEVAFSYSATTTNSSDVSISCSSHSPGSEAEIAYAHPLNKAKLFLERQCN